MKHDYKAALYELSGYAYDLPDDLWETVLNALKLAEKVTGEPSFDVYTEGESMMENLDPILVFKAMITQAQREIEDDR
jgi:hypothetical protein